MAHVLVRTETQSNRFSERHGNGEFEPAGETVP